MLQRSSDQLDDGLNEQAGSAVERWSQPTVDLRELARILRRRWKLVAAIPIALLTVALIYVVSATTLYTATSTFLVDINVSSESPRKAAVIANAVAEGYFEEQVRAKNDATRIASTWLNGQIDALKSRVVAAERAVEDFRSANNLTVSQGVTVNDQQITDLNNQLIAARVQTAEARAKFDQIQQLRKSGSDPGAFNAAISSDIVSKLRAQYADIAKNEADLSSKYGARHPLVANVHAQLRDTQRLINEELQRILQSTRHDYDVARSREASLQQSFDQLQGASTSSGQAQVRLRELQREAEANRTLYESYLARYKETTAQESLAMPDYHVVT